MGTNTFTTKNPGDVISSDDPNQYKDGLTIDHIPRNSSGVATDLAGNLGSLLFRWARLFTNAITLGAIANGLKIEDDSGDIVLKVDDTIVVRINSSGITKNSIAASGSFLTGSFDASASGTAVSTVNSFAGATFSGTIVTTGGPVMLGLLSVGTVSGSHSGVVIQGTAAAAADIRWTRAGTIDVCNIGVDSSTGGTTVILTPSALNHIDYPAAGTHVYTMRFRSRANASALSLTSVKFYGREII